MIKHQSCTFSIYSTFYQLYSHSDFVITVFFSGCLPFDYILFGTFHDFEIIVMLSF